MFYSKQQSFTSTRSIFKLGMQIRKALINDHLHVSKLSCKFCIPTIYNFAVIYS